MGRLKSPPNFQLQYAPADMPSLVAEYLASSASEDRAMEEAGKLIAGGDYARANLEVIYRWKSARRIDLLARNSDAEIRRALKSATSAADAKEAVCSLTPLCGVGVKMASAILTAIYPDRFTVLDFRALEALGLEDSEDVDFYVLYVEACQRVSRSHGVGLRDFDRANWQWSKRKAKPTAVSCDRSARPSQSRKPGSQPKVIRPNEYSEARKARSSSRKAGMRQ